MNHVFMVQIFTTDKKNQTTTLPPIFSISNRKHELTEEQKKWSDLAMKISLLE
jgi:hypothetical protein